MTEPQPRRERRHAHGRTWPEDTAETAALSSRRGARRSRRLRGGVDSRAGAAARRVLVDLPDHQRGSRAGLSGAWLGRLGFLLFGLSVLLIADVCRRRWGPWGTGLHAAFGALMTAAAAFSHRPWPAEQTFDRTEDLLHSVAASGMGLAFAAGVVAVALIPPACPQRRRVLDVIAVAASVALPLAMAAAPSLDGLLQRLMLAVAYSWYAAEAVRAGWPRPVPVPPDDDRRPVTAGPR